jgi:hypothetical protein
MLMLQNMKAWVQMEVVGARQWLLYAMKEMYWAAVLAAGMQCLGGRTGNVKKFAAYVVLFRALKFPLEVLFILKHDVKFYMQALNGP